MVVLSFSVPYGKMMIPSSLYVSIWCQSNGVIHIKGCVSIGWNDSSWLYGIIQHCGWYKTKHVILLYIVCMHIYIYIQLYIYKTLHYHLLLWMCTLTQTCTVFWKPLLRFPPSSGIDVNMMPFRMGDKEPWRRMWCHTYDIIWVHEYQSEERLLATYIHIIAYIYDFDGYP